MITINDIDVFLLSYNREKYICEMLDSLCNQSVGKFQITILDNGSDDMTEELIRKLNNPLITFLGSEKNNGALWNLERAQQLAQKPYVVLFHDDDLLHPRYLEYALKALNEHSNVSLVCSGMLATNNPNKLNFKPYAYTPIWFEDISRFVSLIYLGFPLNFSTVIYKTGNFKKVKIDFEQYGKIADRPIIYDVAAYGGDIVLFSGQYIQYRLHMGQDSGNNRTGPFYHQTIALQKKYKDIIFNGKDDFISKLFFIINFYRYAKEEYSRFYNVSLSFQEYKDTLLKELTFSHTLFFISKVCCTMKLHYIYKLYRLVKRKFGEYS